MKFRRIYHPWNEWEEVRFNMWGEVEDRRAAIQQAIAFTGNHALYGKNMMRVVREWPISCENALTDSFINRKAWVGHAAVALALNLPEDITRAAWGFLTSEQQLLANKEAERAIRWWEHHAGKNFAVCEGLGEPMLSGWDTGRGAAPDCGELSSAVLQGDSNVHPAE
jgi:hypothetical protein